MLIEFFGLPGSGKTTLAKRLSLASGIPTTPRNLMLGNKARIIRLAQSVLTERSLISSLIHGQTFHPARRMLQFRRAYRVFHAVRRIAEVDRQQDWFISDQAALQALWSWIQSGGLISSEQLISVLHRAYVNGCPAVAVFVRITPEIAFDRVTHRVSVGGNWTRFARVEREVAVSQFRRSGCIFDRLVDRIMCLSGHLLVVDGDAELETNVTRIIQFLGVRGLPLSLKEEPKPRSDRG